MRYALYSETSPREWVRANWTIKNTIYGLDVSNLIVEHLSFDGLVIASCDLSGAVMVDCDFRGTVFEASQIQRTVFDRCRVDGDTDVHSDGNSLEAIVSGEVREVLVTTPPGLVEALSAVSQAAGIALPKGMPTAAKVRELVVSVLRRLVSSKERIQQVSREELLEGGNGEDGVVLDRIIVPIIIRRMCVPASKPIGGGTRVLYELHKRWRSAARQFLDGGKVTQELQEVLGGITARATRYFS